MYHHRVRLIGRSICLPLITSVVLSSPGQAQTRPSAFTIDDVLGLTSVRAEALSPDGNWLAVTAGTTRDFLGVDNHRFGDPTYVNQARSELRIIDTRTGATRDVFPSSRALGRESAWVGSRAMAWSPDSRRLVFSSAGGGDLRVHVLEWPSGDSRTLDLPQDRQLAWSQRTQIRWSPDGESLYIPLRPVGWAVESKRGFDRLTEGPISVYTSAEPFLAWEALRRLGNRYSVVSYDLESNTIRDVLPEMTINGFYAPEGGESIVYLEDIADSTDYTRFAEPSALRIRSLDGGEPRTLIESTEDLTLHWSPDHRHFAYAEKEGDIYFGSIGDTEPRRLIDHDPEETREPEQEDDPGTEDPPKKPGPLAVVRVSSDGTRLIASNDEGLWLIDTRTSAQDLFLPKPDNEDEKVKYEVVAWSNDGDEIYLNYGSESRWERGFSRYTVSTRELESLERSDRLYNNMVFGFQLPTHFSKNDNTLVFYSAAGNRPLDLYATDPNFERVVRLTDANAGLTEKTFGDTELLTYLDTDGEELKGVLYYPVGYEPGVRYPTVFIVYEGFFHNVFDEQVSLLTNQGYAVVTPSVNLEIGYPGEAWVKGVTAVANLLIERGITDGDRMGVQGISYGGYATNLLVSQTNRFAAAVNISGKADMISFYTDSPRLGIRNIHAPENSQDRIGGTLWEQPLKYLNHSAVMFADRIETPLLLLTGEQDHNVPARTTLEMYYALRRLGKRVEWVNYVNGGHGPPNTDEAELRDYYERISGWYARYLKDASGATEPRADR